MVVAFCQSGSWLRWDFKDFQLYSMAFLCTKTKTAYVIPPRFDAPDTAALHAPPHHRHRKHSVFDFRTSGAREMGNMGGLIRAIASIALLVNLLRPSEGFLSLGLAGINR